MPPEHTHEISGVVEQLTYYNAESGFTVLRIKTTNHENVTIVANASPISIGETILAQGMWHNDAKYGPQFKATNIITQMPTTTEGIRKYLASGLIKGIGPCFASRIVQVFGSITFKIIEESPERLKEIEGIGETRLQMILTGWNENKSIRAIVLFLQKYSISPSIANKLFQAYGQNTIHTIQQNPYQLINDIRGIGFLSADKIAMELGMPPDSIERAKAAIKYILVKEVGEGHCAFPKELLITIVTEKLKIRNTVAEEAYNILIQEKKLFLSPKITAYQFNNTLPSNLSPQDIPNIAATACVEKTTSDIDLVYLPLYWRYENIIANKLFQKAHGSVALFKNINIHYCLEKFQQAEHITLSADQQKALYTICNAKLSIITGGPGTGKTTLINALLKIIKIANETVRIQLAAPTGRAAKRMTETTKIYAKTIHRLLEFDYKRGAFKYNESHTLKCDLLIVDESSMIDISLMSALLNALPDAACLMLVGDADQIPSVGPGQVLLDIIKSNAANVIYLKKIFRQAANSQIVLNAHLINRGMMPKLTKETDTPSSDFIFIDENSPENIAASILSFIQVDCPRDMPQIDIRRDIQILSPMQRGSLGVQTLNVMIQKALNPRNKSEFIEKNGIIYGIGDKVMHIENNYDKNVFNGDLGFINFVNKEEVTLSVDFDGREILYEFSDLEQLILAYAITVHKSQGSEYPVVILPLTTQHFIMLNKNLLYTSITRAKKAAVLVGQKKALAIAVRNNKVTNRYSRLKDLIAQKLSPQEGAL